MTTTEETKYKKKNQSCTFHKEFHSSYTSMDKFEGQLSSSSNTSSMTRQQQGTALRVSNLHESISEVDLFNLFNQTVIDVRSTKVCRDKLTGASLRYGYVNLYSHEDGNFIVENMNGCILGGSALHIQSTSKDNARNSKSNLCTVYVNNLHPEMTSRDIMTVFRQFGHIFSSWVVSDKNGISKEYGFIEFSHEDFAHLAIEKGQNMSIHGKAIHTAPYASANSSYSRIIKPNGIIKNPRSSSTTSASIGDDDNWTNCYVKHIPFTWNKDKILSVFSDYGYITSFKILENEDGEATGSGLVNYSNHKDAERACRELRHPEARRMIVSKAFKNKYKINDDGYRSNTTSITTNDIYYDTNEATTTSRKAPQRLNVYVNHLASSISEETLREMFLPYGRITSVIIMKNHDKSNRGYGFVRFVNPEDALEAVANMNDQMVHGNQIYAAFALRKNKSIPKSNNIRKVSTSSRYLKNTMNYAIAGHSGYNMYHISPYYTGMYYPSNTPSHVPPPSYPATPQFKLTLEYAESLSLLERNSVLGPMLHLLISSCPYVGPYYAYGITGYFLHNFELYELIKFLNFPDVLECKIQECFQQPPTTNISNEITDTTTSTSSSLVEEYNDYHMNSSNYGASTSTKGRTTPAEHIVEEKCESIESIIIPVPQ